MFASQATIAIKNARVYQELQLAHIRLKKQSQEQLAKLAAMNNQLQQQIHHQNQIEESLRQDYNRLKEEATGYSTALSKANEQLIWERTDRKLAENQLEAALQEKQIAQKEMVHRVKNNLQVVSCLLSLQAGYAYQPEIKNILQENQRRLHAMALIQEKLYQTENLAEIDFAAYIRNLSSDLFRAYNLKQREIMLKVEAEKIWLSIEKAIPAGMILNELVTNAIQHGFPGGRAGEIQIKLQKGLDHQLTLTVRDNGPGFPPGFNFDQAASLGLRLVHILVKQLEGKLKINQESGIEFKITFSHK